eukprot:gene3576-4455_t
MSAETSNDQKDQTFVTDDIVTILKEAVEVSIQNSDNYQHSKVSQWTSSIIDHSLKKISELDKPYKYIGTGFHSGSSCLWDATTDRSCCYKWENKSMHCITTVFGCRI